MYYLRSFYASESVGDRVIRRFSFWKKKPKQQDLEKSAEDSREQRLLPKVGPESPTVPQV